MSVRAVGEQDDGEFLFFLAFLEDGDGSVQVLAECGLGAGSALSRERELSEVDTTADGDCHGVP